MHFHVILALLIEGWNKTRMCVQTPWHLVCSKRVFGSGASFLTYSAHRFPHHQTIHKIPCDWQTLDYVGSLSLHDQCLNLRGAVPCEEFVDHLAECRGLWVMLLVLLLVVVAVLVVLALVLVLGFVPNNSIGNFFFRIVFTIPLKLPPLQTCPGTTSI